MTTYTKTMPKLGRSIFRYEVSIVCAAYFMHQYKFTADVRLSPIFKSLLLLQFSINLNQTWQKVRTHGGAKNVGSGILNFCLWVEKSRRLCQFLSIYSNRYSSYVSQPILTKLGTKLEPIGRQKMLGAEFWFLLLCGKKQTTLLSFKVLLFSQFSCNLNQMWHKVRNPRGVGGKMLEAEFLIFALGWE